MDDPEIMSKTSFGQKMGGSFCSQKQAKQAQEVILTNWACGLVIVVLGDDD